MHDERVAKKLANWIDGLGYKRAVSKSDQEAAVVAWTDAVRRIASTELAPGHSPKKDCPSNGLAEFAVKELAGMVRTLKDHLQEKLNIRLDWSSPMLT